MRVWLAVACFLLGLSLVLQAFVAHVFKPILDGYSLDVLGQAITSQSVHAAAIVLVGILSEIEILLRSRAKFLCWIFMAGIILFCGPLYLSTLAGVQSFGAVTPFGGSLLIIGWFFLAFSILYSFR